MLFNKKLVTIAVLASSMVAGSALAADGKKGAEVTFKAQIRAASCDVTSTTKGSVIDWGIFTVDQAAGKGVKDTLGEPKLFDLVLTNCSKDGSDTTMNVYAQGQEATGFPELFADKDAKSLAVKLESGTDPILPNIDSPVTLTDSVKAGNGATIPMKASLLLTKADGVAPDILRVPVTFTVSYN
ncbi:fimbrial protein [Providencia stuartii]|uniref:fimbrial protein n=1 Tax=Providencia TaxID=586 RepID=UPI0004F7E375|nr:fimbrial protein [Providencia stuartii]AIN64103.1 fimbrial family protein [Providencia stuartii]AXO18895.1 type 1 fimbrial protein [Providencia stuartii]KNZ87045.1 fimbrial protein [Providencia stuartii]MBG5898096.1 type 1 fimbrial protein [Providencia stuartii]MBK1419636.1 type 1 fimbrial protein [Providencia stuartii]